MRLNLGCGAHTPAGWVNVDYALGARLARNPVARRMAKSLRIFSLDWNDRIFIHNLTRTFPWPEGCAEAVYCSHSLEHFTREEGLFIVSEAFRVLAHQGVIRILVPDLRFLVDRYLTGSLPAEHFVEALGVLYRTGGKGLKAKLVPFIQYPHKCMYDSKSLVTLLEQAGFTAAIRGPFESLIKDINEIESFGRTEAAVIVEGIKI